jgi:VWFA-related protein
MMYEQHVRMVTRTNLGLTEVAQGPSQDHELMEWGCRFVRQRPPGEFERLWMLTSYALLELSQNPATDGSGVSQVLSGHLQHARSRFPHDSDLRFAELQLRPEIAAMSNRPGARPDSLVRPAVNRGRPIGPSGRAQIGVSLRDLEKLIHDPVVGSEARAHAGLLRFHLNDLSSALLDLRGAAMAAQDSFVRNLAWLAVGLTLDAQAEHGLAADAFRSAQEALPSAKSSGTMLAVHLFLAGDRHGASVMLDDIHSADPGLDPWRRSSTRYRFAADWMHSLRTMAGPIEATAQARAVVLPSVAPTDRMEQGVSGRHPEAAGPASRTGQSTAVFRGGTNAVSIDVSVLSRNNPVLGLVGSDFELLDNGVRQDVSALPVELGPLDLSLVLDDRQSPLGSLAGARSPGAIEMIREDLPRIVGELRPFDRVRVIVTHPEPLEVVRLRLADRPLVGAEVWRVRASLATAAVGAAYGPRTRLYDAVVAALMREVPADRRHMVIVASSGADDGSVVTPERMVAVASQATAVMHVIRRPTEVEALRQGGTRESAALAQLAAARSLWAPDPSRIERAAELTGGLKFYRTPGTSLAQDFKAIFDTFRRGYVLHYTPTQVAPRGRHEVRIRILRQGKFEVHAKKGYGG